MYTAPRRRHREAYGSALLVPALIGEITAPVLGALGMIFAVRSGRQVR